MCAQEDEFVNKVGLVFGDTVADVQKVITSDACYKKVAWVNLTTPTVRFTLYVSRARAHMHGWLVGWLRAGFDSRLSSCPIPVLPHPIR